MSCQKRLESRDIGNRNLQPTWYFGGSPMSTNIPITIAHGFIANNGGTTSKKTVALLGRVLEQGLEIVKTGTPRTYAAAGYTVSQGQ